MAADGTITLNGKDYAVDDLTLDEVAELEEAGGGSLEELDFRRAKVLKALSLILLRRDNPDITAEEVGAIRFVSLAGENGTKTKSGTRPKRQPAK